MKITYFHNPRCSKSREGLALLRENDYELTLVEYLKVGFDEKTLRIIIERLEQEVNQLIRTNEHEFIRQPFDVNNEEAVVRALMSTPKLFQRPVALSDEVAVIGRPPSILLDKLH